MSIQGTGEKLLGTVNQMFDSNEPPLSKLKGHRGRPPRAPKTAHNTILAASIEDKWSVAFAHSGSENSGLFQRVTIINSNSTNTVKKLAVPTEAMQVIGTKIARMVAPLEYQKALVRDTPEAEEIFESWFDEFKERTKDDSPDVRGRINVQVQRNKNILAWALNPFEIEPPPLVRTVDLSKEDVPVNTYVRPQLPPTREILVTPDIMRRALKLAEYQLAVRRVSQPIVGASDWVICENKIRQIVKNFGGPISRSQLSKMIHVERFGIKTFSIALQNLQNESQITITKGGVNRRTEMIEWVKE
jgi:hypothetical protein